MKAPYRLIRPLLFAVAPETAHRLAIHALARGIARQPPATDPRLSNRVLGLDFPNVLGLAAGFDKNGEVPDAILNLGFGFVEVGTVTPLPQQGNPRPRLFRLTADRALINRLGFNNQGHDAVYARLKRRTAHGIVGVNLGANKDSADRIGDYVAGLERFAHVADYLTINVSSPNTPGLRDLQAKEQLSELLARLSEARARLSGMGAPLLLKIAPDLGDPELAGVADAALAAGIDGMIVSNTTLSRDGLSPGRHSSEAGGLSGKPLFRRSTIMLARLRLLVGKRMVLVGAGGVDSAETTFAKITAGADLVQLYTGMVFGGPGLPTRILDGLAGELDRHDFATIADAVGADTALWAAAAP
ncbi:MAG: quinone-dependent dihydroorotate dehydrogenase [Bauldia sp.]